MLTTRAESARLRARAAVDHLWREAIAQRAGLLLAVASVAVGVALALAVHLVNQGALAEFGRAMAVVNGQAQAQIVPARGQAFDESVLDRVLAEPRLKGLIGEVSPVIELRTDFNAAGLPNAVQARLLGIDPFRAAPVTPDLLMQPDERLGRTPDAESEAGSLLFGADSVFLSPALARRLSVQPGERIRVGPAGASVELRVAGSLPGAQPHQELAAMDIGTLQWRLNWLGRLSRIDIVWAREADAVAARRVLRERLGTEVEVTEPDQAVQKSSNLSRAYRVNLGVLSLVASFTGAFLVWSSLSTAVSKQQRNLALLGMIGFSRRALFRAILLAGLGIGLAGALLGAALGVALARLLVRTVGADLGGGYFSSQGFTLEPGLAPIAGFVALGVVVALAGAWFPAREAASLAWASALRGQVASASTARRSSAILLAGLGALLLMAPAVSGLPIAAYAAIACWLLAGIQLNSSLIRQAAKQLNRLESWWARWPVVWLAVTRYQSERVSIRHSARAAAAVVASFALASAMAIMVYSFRGSVAEWLDRVLPADLYARADDQAGAGMIDASAQARISAWPGLSRAVFMRSLRLNLDPSLPDVMLLARPLRDRLRSGEDSEESAVARVLPLTGELRQAPPGTVAVYASEAAAALHRWRVGEQIAIVPLHPNQRFFVAGLWRDYARQSGAIVVDLDDYRSLTSDPSINEVALWLTDGQREQAVLAQARADPDPVIAALQWRSAEELRRLSLRIFDRSFALTYVLEAVAIVIALAGVTAGFSAQALTRLREFSVTRFLGLTRRGLLVQLGVEAAVVLSISVAWGAALGSAIAGILIWRVNPQSFHWTMDLRWPLLELTVVAALLVLLGSVAALMTAQRATRPVLAQTLHEDW